MLRDITPRLAYPPAATADDDAEHALAACCVVARDAAAQALARLHADDLRDPRVWRVIRAAAERYGRGEGADLDADIAAIAAAAGVEPAVIRRWVEAPRPVYADAAGTLARVIADAAARRAGRHRGPAAGAHG